MSKMMKALWCICILSYTLSSPLFAQRPKQTYKNPILTGYHPDPSICRKGDDYYLINSSFEWFPGIPIHKSKDLVNWELIGYAMKDPDKTYNHKINVFAPTIRYHDGLFYIITTCPGAGGNFYITAQDPAGEWSAPVYLEDAPGIDPSIFWDKDGRCYYIGQNHANPRNWLGHNDIWIQELDLKQGKLVGERRNIATGHAANAMWTEAPHLYQIDGKYLLLLAEGGTDYYHAVTIFHSENLWGPYTPDHANPIITHRHLGEDYPTYAIGHADFVDTPNGEWWMVSLGKRRKNGYACLARETFLIPMKMEARKGLYGKGSGDYNTIVVNQGKGIVPDEHVRPNLPWTPVESLTNRDDFDQSELALYWNFRGVPTQQWYQLEDGQLSMPLRSEVVSKKYVNPSLIARRIRDYAFEVNTKMNFTTDLANEQAGIILYRNDDSYAMLTQKGKEIVLESSRQGDYKEIFRAPYEGGETHLRMVSDGENVHFYYGKSPRRLKKIAGEVSLTIVSDLVPNIYNGPMVGMYCSSNGQKSNHKATFDWFSYEGED